MLTSATIGATLDGSRVWVVDAGQRQDVVSEIIGTLRVPPNWRSDSSDASSSFEPEVRIIKPLIALTLTALLLVSASTADAKGCIKGAVVGGVAGHAAGHGVMGTAAGCAYGRHRANQQTQKQPQQQGQPQN
jgi:hypothetical protein